MFNNFTSQELIEVEGRYFISNVIQSQHTFLPMFMVTCDFNINNYQQKIYSKLDITFPSNIQNSVIKRQAEFLAGRYTARLAIQRNSGNQKLAPQILIGDKRQPLWPEGLKGSISHTSNKAICVITSSSAVKGVGIDIEKVIPNQSALEISSYIHSDLEKHILVNNNIPTNIATTILYSAKESIFKALYLTVKDYFSFESAQLIQVDVLKGTLIFALAQDFAASHQLPDLLVTKYVLYNNDVMTLTIFSQSDTTGSWQD